MGSTCSIRNISTRIELELSTLQRRSAVISWPSLVRQASRLRLPFWLWAIIIGFVPTRLLATIDYLFVPPKRARRLLAGHRPSPIDIPCLLRLRYSFHLE